MEVMAYEQPERSMEEVRRGYKLVALVGLGGDMVILAVFWLMNFLPQDILLVLTIVLMASGSTMAYLFIKVFPDRIARSRGLG